ncbi:hypothetical protein [Marinobacter sp. ELB17]|uniref:hypothetical protein n=1 Tax=Marinobacter sp. ELB17 TaxID=270374 RepID=UPI0000F38DF4|nr:hypothetical protein [Marinobacter sp. ELB17]EBA00899.1 hypothetical protein MELB17_17639 [Marinobacter sp. ELB17]
MNMQLTAHQISKALFEIDPMNTCCKENDCFDEYDLIAADVAESLEAGATLKDALAGAINEWFYDGEELLKSESIVEPTIEMLKEAGSHDRQL